MATTQPNAPLDVTSAVNERYSKAAAARETEFCCPVDYDPKFLDAISRGILDRD